MIKYNFNLDNAINLILNKSKKTFNQSINICIHYNLINIKNIPIINNKIILPYFNFNKKIFLLINKNDDKYINIIKNKNIIPIYLDKLIFVIKKKKNKINILLTTYKMIKSLKKIYNILNNKNLIPNIKNNTLFKNIKLLIKNFKNNYFNIKNNKFGIINSFIGKINYNFNMIKSNIIYLLKYLKNKNLFILNKKKFFKKIFLSSTMGPNIKILI